MVTRLDYRNIIKEIILGYARLKPAYSDIDSRVMFDDERASYALMQVGWDGDHYIHGSIIHVEFINEKIWIQYDGTEMGVAQDLMDAGIPKEAIVLGFRPEKIRAHTGFAIK